MKTNKILMAVALPALLAACTAEEVVEQSPVANLSGRAVLDPNFSVNVAEGIDSRFAWEGLNWKYEAGDQFGAGVVDPAVYGEISDANMLGNYIFAKSENGYKTDSQMSEGTYLFYSYDGFKTKSSRSLVTFDISSQKTDMENPEAMVNEYANQLMFSPLYNIEAEYSAEALPLEFRSFWGVAAFKFKNNTGQTLKISQVVLHDKVNKFIVKGGINPALLAKAGLTYVYNENGAKYNGTEGKANEHNYVPAAVSTLIDAELDANFTEKDRKEAIEKAYEAFEDALYTKPFSKDVEENGSSSFIALNCQNYKMKHGETATVYMLVPQHKGGNLQAEIMVVNEDDESQSVFVTGSDVDGLRNLEIMRHKTNAIFGKTTDGKGMKTFSFTEDDLEENTGYYIDDNDKLIALINANLGSIRVHNTGDTYIDAEVVKAIKEYTGTHVTFSNAIEIKDAEELVYDEDTDTDLSLTEITFMDGAVVKGENKKKDIDGTVEFGNEVYFSNGKLVVEEGANVTLTEGAYSSIVNNGNLVVEKDVTGLFKESKTLVELPVSLLNKAGSATLKIDNVTVNAEAGSVSFAGTSKNKLNVSAKNLTIAAGADLTIGEYVTLAVDENETIAVAYDAEKDAWAKSTWTNNGTINIASGKKLTVKNALVNNGIIADAGTLETVYTETKKKDGTTKTDVKPNITVGENGEVNVANIIVNHNSTVTNAGEFGWNLDSKSIEVYGEVTMVGSSSRLEVTDCVNELTEEKGIVDNSDNGVVKAPTEMLIAATVPAMTDGEYLKNFDIDGQIGMIKVTGTWTITADPEYSAEEALEELGIKTVRFMTTKAVDVRSNATLNLSTVKVELYGVEEVVFSGRTESTSTLILSEKPESQNMWWKNNTVGYQPETPVYNNIKVINSTDFVEDAFEKGETVTLETSVAVNSPIVVDGGQVLELNGNTLSAENGSALIKTETNTTSTDIIGGIIKAETGVEVKGQNVDGFIYLKDVKFEGKYVAKNNGSTTFVCLENCEITLEQGGLILDANDFDGIAQNQVYVYNVTINGNKIKNVNDLKPFVTENTLAAVAKDEAEWKTWME